MALHKLAGKPAPRSLLVNIPRLVTSYYSRKPDAAVGKTLVSSSMIDRVAAYLNRKLSDTRFTRRASKGRST